MGHCLTWIEFSFLRTSVEFVVLLFLIETVFTSFTMTMKSSENLSFFRMYTQRRYIVAYMVHFGCAIMYIIRTNLSVAIVPMSKEFDWNSTDQGFVLSSFYYGYILTQLLGGALSKRFSPTHVFSIAIGISVVLNLITPLTRGSLTAIIVVRALEGVALGVTFPASMAITAIWSPIFERSIFTMIINTGIHVGTVLALIGSGFLNDYLGYESIFYVFGVLGLLWFFAWLFIVRASPEQDPWISEREKTYILENIEVNDRSTRLSDVPWSKIILSVPVWSLVIAHFTYTWGAYTLITQMPTFLSDTIGLKLGKTGFLACLPYIISMFLSIPAGALTDFLIKRNILTRIVTRKSFTCASFLVQMTFMLLAAFLMSPVGSMVSLTIAVGFQTVSQCGYGVNFLDIAPQYAGIIFGFTNTFGTLSGIFSPILTGAIVQNQVSQFSGLIETLLTG